MILNHQIGLNVKIWAQAHSFDNLPRSSLLVSMEAWLVIRQTIPASHSHTGRRTSRRHQTVLEVIEYRPDVPEFVVISGFGPGAEWLKNIQIGPAFVEVGTRSFAADHRFLPETEAVEVIRGYERRNRLLKPIIRVVLTRLLGWRYKATDSDRLRLVNQLPLIAFRTQ